MKALSVRAPWWWAILHLGKDIENRDWHTNFRGTIYLHAGKYWKDSAIEEDIDDISFIMGDAIPEIFCPEEALYDGRGCLVGKVDIVDCVKESESRWFFGDFGFVLRNPVAFPRPIPFKGALGFFDVPDNIWKFPPEQQSNQEIETCANASAPDARKSSVATIAIALRNAEQPSKTMTGASCAKPSRTAVNAAQPADTVPSTTR